MQAEVTVLESLAEGIDPQSGERVPTGSPFNRPEVSRALKGSVHSLQRQPHREHAPASSGLSWSMEERAHLVRSYRAGRGVTTLAQLHDRSEADIREELRRLGLAI